MHYPFTLQSILWFAAQALQVGLLVVLVKRGLHQRYPWFTAYIAVEALTDPFLAIARGRWEYTYYFGYWLTVIATTVLTIAILYEVLRQVWLSPESGKKIGKVMVWMIVAAAIFEAVARLLVPRQFSPDQITELVLSADRNVQIVTMGMALFILWFGRRLGMSWRELSVGIVGGLAFFSLAHLTVATAMSHSRVFHRSTLGLINSAAYVVTLLIWLGYATRSSKLTFGGSGDLGSGGSSPHSRSHAFMGLQWKREPRLELER